MSLRKMGLNWSKALGIALASTVGFYANSSFAQITPDQTLPTNSNVTSEENLRTITGGTQRGGNLFHSFREFSVPNGLEAFFNNGADIQNILTRVTGGSISEINGLIRANGGANLFLMNPNGIVFGPNARLNIGGSFFGTSANSIKFANGKEFSAVDPQSPPPLLTIDVPLGLQYGTNPGSIRVEGNGQGARNFDDPIIDTQDALRVGSDKTLALVGGDIDLEGATLKTAGGRIELGSVAGNGFVGLTPDNKGFALDYGGVENFGDIRLSQQANVDASGEGAGDVKVQSRRLSLSDVSRIETSTLGALQGGSLVVNATESVEVATVPLGGLFSQVYLDATGDGGDLNIQTRQLVLRNVAQVTTETFGTGNSGNLNITASESVEIITSSADAFSLSGLSTRSVGGQFSANGEDFISTPTGNAGDLTITTGQLLLDGGSINTDTFSAGKGGDLNITASESIKIISGSNVPAPGGLFSSSGGIQISPTGEEFIFTPTGDAGDLTIKTGQLLVDRSWISTTTYGAGKGGNLNITASESIKFIAESNALGVSGVLSTASGGGLIAIPSGEEVILRPTGDGGDLNIQTGQLLVDGGQIVTATAGAGKGGDLNITASESIEIIGTPPNDKGRPGLVTSSGLLERETDITDTKATGDAGDLNITTNLLRIKEGGVVAVGSRGQGNAGDLNIDANSIRLDNDALIAADTQSVTKDPNNPQANINIRSQDLILRRGSNITANARGENVIGGNINIDTGVLAGFENSNIKADSIDSRGGNILIDAEGVFNMQFRDEDSLLTSDITATGANNELGGNVEIDTTQSDPTRGLGEVEADTVDSSTQISDPCVPGGRGFGNSFVSIGRGGLPMTPMEPLQETGTISTWVRLKPQSASTTNRNTTNRKTSSQPTTAAKTPKAEKQTEVEKPTQIVEANGWIVNTQGNIEFVAQANHTNPTSPWQNPASCSVSSEKEE